MVANIITVSRILLSFVLLFLQPFELWFMIVYSICGLTDILDGFIARKFNMISQLGATLDSIADFVFICIMLVVFLPVIDFASWMIIWLAGIMVIRFASIIIAYIRYHQLSFLHTYLNKLSGLIIFCFPFFYGLTNLNITFTIIAGIATISGLEELLINFTSKNLNKDRKSIFIKD